MWMGKLYFLFSFRLFSRYFLDSIRLFSDLHLTFCESLGTYWTWLPNLLTLFKQLAGKPKEIAHQPFYRSRGKATNTTWSAIPLRLSSPQIFTACKACCDWTSDKSDKSEGQSVFAIFKDTEVFGHVPPTYACPHLRFVSLPNCPPVT